MRYLNYRTIALRHVLITLPVLIVPCRPCEIDSEAFHKVKKSPAQTACMTKSQYLSNSAYAWNPLRQADIQATTASAVATGTRCGGVFSCGDWLSARRRPCRAIA